MQILRSGSFIINKIFNGLVVTITDVTYDLTVNKTAFVKIKWIVKPSYAQTTSLSRYKILISNDSFKKNSIEWPGKLYILCDFYI